MRKACIGLSFFWLSIVLGSCSRSSEYGDIREGDVIKNTNGQKICEISGFLGSGSYGKVYKCTGLDKRANIEYALKVVRKYTGSGNAIEAAQLEALTGRCMSSWTEYSQVAKVYGVYKGDDRGYILMEFLDGKSLSSVIRSSSNLRECDVLRIMIWAVILVIGLEKRQICHRDISLSNIMRVEDGRFCLIDFGLARFINGVPKGLPKVESHDYSFIRITDRCKDRVRLIRLLEEIRDISGSSKVRESTYRIEKIWEECQKTKEESSLNLFLKRLLARHRVICHGDCFK